MQRIWNSEKHSFTSGKIGEATSGLRTFDSENHSLTHGGKIPATDFGTRKTTHLRGQNPGGGKIPAVDLELEKPVTHLNIKPLRQRDLKQRYQRPLGVD